MASVLKVCWESVFETAELSAKSVSDGKVCMHALVTME